MRRLRAHTHHQIRFVQEVLGVEPEPAASRRIRITGRTLLGWSAVGVGAVTGVVVVVAALPGTSLLLGEFSVADEATAATFGVGCGLALVGCGIGVLRNSLLAPVGLFGAAVVCGVLSTILMW